MWLSYGFKIIKGLADKRTMADSDPLFRAGGGFITPTKQRDLDDNLIRTCSSQTSRLSSVKKDLSILKTCRSISSSLAATPKQTQSGRQRTDWKCPVCTERIPEDKKKAFASHLRRFHPDEFAKSKVLYFEFASQHQRASFAQQQTSSSPERLRQEEEVPHSQAVYRQTVQNMARNSTLS